MKKLFLCLIISNFMIAKKTEWITIFVHGAVALRSNLSLELFGPLLSDTIEGTSYEKNVVKVRQNRYLYTMQAMQGLGLRPIKKDISAPPGAYAFATLYDSVTKLSNPEIKNRYYTFGWTGLISYKRRYEESKILYEQIRRERKRLLQLGIEPKIRLVGYSHGANLILNLIALRARNYSADTFCIDEAILLGAPVSIRTMKLIECPLIKKIYHIYSNTDFVQMLDITVPGHNPRRTFYNRCVPQSLKQIELRFIAEPLRKNCLHSRHQPVNQSPGHFEYWFFGWAPNYYRQDLRIYPIPFGVLAPLIVKAISNESNCSSRFVVDIRYKDECIIVTDICTKIKKVVPFLNHNELALVRKKALSFHPSNEKYKAKFLELQNNIDPNAYK